MTGKNHSLKTARIKDVAELDPETLGESTAPDFTFKYIDLSSVKGGRIGDELESMTFAAAPGRARKLIKEGDVLLGMVRPYLKPFAKVQTALDGHVASTGFAVIRAKSGVTDSEYLYQTIWSDSISKQIHQMVTGSNYPALSVGDVKDLKIPLPPLAEQRKIAEILRTWDEAIETAEAELKAKQERKRWLMDKLLRLGAARLSKLSASGWTVQKLGDILEIRHGKNQREVETPEGSYPILGTGGIIGRTNSYLYDKPSVLIGRKGTIDRPQYMDTPFWTIDTLFYTSISDSALPRFIFYVFCTINWQQYNAATGVPSLAASTIESIRIHLPPLAEQRKITDILQTVDADMEVINCRIESFRIQKRGLMQKLLTGEVRVAA